MTPQETIAHLQSQLDECRKELAAAEGTVAEWKETAEREKRMRVNSIEDWAEEHTNIEKRFKELILKEPDTECMPSAEEYFMACADHLVALTKECESLRADKDRLDWLEANPAAIRERSVNKSWGRKVWWMGPTGDYDTAREAIDAATSARAAETPNP